jgi:hypothetical protein
MRDFDATLEDAADLRRAPRLSRAVAIAIAAGVALLLVAYGLLAFARMRSQERALKAPRHAVGTIDATR